MGERPTSSASAIETVVVVVPARDEAVLLGRCLLAIAVAAQHARTRAAVVRPVVVVADRCVDATAETAARSGADVVVSDHGLVGAARRDGVSAALLGVDVARTWIANTDADSQVPPHWLTAQLDAASAGADACLGTVRLDDGTTAAGRAWRRDYARGGVGASRERDHGHVHGTNLGVRAEAYLAVGGFEGVGEHEDRDLVRRLRAAGRTIAWPDDLVVTTDARLLGRSPGGLSGDLLRRTGLEVAGA